MMKNREIIDKLDRLNGSLSQEMPILYRKYWERYRNAMCDVIGEDYNEHKLYWE